MQAGHVLLQVFILAGGLDWQQIPRRYLRLGIGELLGLLSCRSADGWARLRGQGHGRLRQGYIRRRQTLAAGPRRGAAVPGSLGLAWLRSCHHWLRPGRGSRERRQLSRALSHSPTYGRRWLGLPNAKTLRLGRSGLAHFLRRG